jgi:hypothetical protein
VALTAALGLTLAAASCNKPDPIISKQEGTIYMPQAYSDASTLKLYLIDSPQIVAFGAAYGGLNSPGKDVTVNFKLDTTLIAAYNTQYNTSYIPLPASHYQISSFTGTIKAGTTVSTSLPITITTKGLSFGVQYMLPIVMTGISSGTFDSSLSIAYFKIDSLYTREKDITDKGTLSVSFENDGGVDAGESSVHLVDGKTDTKYLAHWQSSGFGWTMTFPTAQVVNAYTFTSANDVPERDPKDWNLTASNDGTNWDTLDVRTGETFGSRFQTIHYITNNNNNKAYTIYRVNVTSNNGADLFQMAEFRLLQYY